MDKKLPRPHQKKKNGNIHKVAGETHPEHA